MNTGVRTTHDLLFSFFCNSIIMCYYISFCKWL